jgi:hypothetical protein
MKTCLDIQNDMESMLPSCVEHTYPVRANWCDASMLRMYRGVGVLKVGDVLLTTAVRSYDLTAISTQIELMNVGKVYVTSTKTTCSTDITLDSKFNEYELRDVRDASNPNYVTFSKFFPDERMMRVQYLAIPALFPTTSSDSTSIPDIDPEAISALEYSVLARMCKSGSAPVVGLANAYESDYREEMKRLKVVFRKRTNKSNADVVSYQEWNW